MGRGLLTGLIAGVFFSFCVPVIAEPIVAAANGKVFHTESECPALKRIAPANREVYASVAQAEAAGRKRCRLCEKIAEQRARPKPQRAQGEGGAATSQPAPLEQLAIEQVLADGEIALGDGERVSPVGLCLPLPGQEGHAEMVKAVRDALEAGSILSVPQTGGERDEFGRRLGYIRIGDEAADLGGRLVAAGLAWVKRDCVHSLHDEYVLRENQAWQKGLGIWKRLDGEAGRVEVVVGRFASSYHAVDCPHVRQLTEASKVPLNEAKARRLTPCELYRMPVAKARRAEGPTTRRSSGKEKRRQG